MKKLKYSIKIQAPPEKVYKTMLGLNSKKTYEEWTSVFDPSSTYEGKWEKGSNITFSAIDKEGKRAGMLARVAENNPNSYVSLQHYGVLENDEEITTGPKVEGWAGALENYRFEPIENGTLLTVEVDTVEQYIDHFNDAWPRGLEKLKKSCEEKKS